MDTEMTSSLNSKYFLYMIKTTHLSDEPYFFLLGLLKRIQSGNLFIFKRRERRYLYWFAKLKF